MSQRESYKIPFIGLKNGIHEYEFTVDETFFSQFDESLVNKAKVKFSIQLDKLTNQINLDLVLYGQVETMCDRCGGELLSELEGEFMLVVKFGDETSDLIDDIITLGPSEHYIALDQLFYEYVHLCLPQRNVHETEEECNPEAIAALKEYQLKEKEEQIDPRWSKLKNLK
ncbi:MAG: DUF177 domain-containing protein [Flavobacteriales bacterium]